MPYGKVAIRRDGVGVEKGGVVFVRYNTIDVDPATTPNAVDPARPESLDLAVVISARGFHIRVNPRFRKPWMTEAVADAQGIPDIPKQNDEYDYAALEKRLRELKQDHSNERRIILGAEEDIAYDVLIKTMDYSRGFKSDLFPDVTLTRETG